MYPGIVSSHSTDTRLTQSEIGVRLGRTEPVTDHGRRKGYFGGGRVESIPRGEMARHRSSLAGAIVSHVTRQLRERPGQVAVSCPRQAAPRYDRLGIMTFIGVSLKIPGKNFNLNSSKGWAYHRFTREDIMTVKETFLKLRGGYLTV